MKKILLVCLAAVALFITPAQAETRADASLFAANMDDSYGAMISLSGGTNLLYKGDITMSSNFGGVGAAVGYRVGKLKIYAGATDVIRMSSQNGFVDVQGEPVFDPSSDAQGDTVFVEARYQQFFVRYSEYDIDNTLRGVRTVNIDGKPFVFSNTKTVNQSGSILWAGVIIPF